MLALDGRLLELVDVAEELAAAATAHPGRLAHELLLLHDGVALVLEGLDLVPALAALADLLVVLALLGQHLADAILVLDRLGPPLGGLGLGLLPLLGLL